MPTHVQVSVPYLRSEYGKEYDFDAPVKLLDAMMHSQAESPGQQVVVLGHCLASDINIGYEDMVNTAVRAVNSKRVGAERTGMLVLYVHYMPPTQSGGFASSSTPVVVACNEHVWQTLNPALICTSSQV